MQQTERSAQHTAGSLVAGTCAKQQAHCLRVRRTQQRRAPRQRRTSSVVCRGRPLFCSQSRPSRCTRPSRLMAAAQVHKPGTTSIGMPNRCHATPRHRVSHARTRYRRQRPQAHALCCGRAPDCRAPPGGPAPGSARPVGEPQRIAVRGGCSTARGSLARHGSPRPCDACARTHRGAGTGGTSLNFSAVCTVRTSGEV